VFGTIHYVDKNGELLSIDQTPDSTQIWIDGDTLIIKPNGPFFDIKLPFMRQREKYTLDISAPGYKTVTEYYYPLSGEINIFLRQK
jgi:hypothetical protein